jgi:branched-chain amino acid transport system permease protein
LRKSREKERGSGVNFIFWELYLSLVAVFILLTWSMYLPFKAGYLYNGPIYSMAIGAYLAAFLVRDLGCPFPLALIAATLFGGFMGYLPSLGFARTSGVATAMASISLIFIIQSIIRNLGFVGGGGGLGGIPEVSYLLPVCYGLVALVGLLIYRLDHSRLGRALEMIIVDPDLAAAMGVNVRRVSVFILTASSTLGALAGVLYAFSLQSINPDSFGFGLLLYVWTMLYLGGRFTMWGALVAAPLLWGLPQWVPGDVAEYTNIFYGLLLVLVLLIRPQGFIGRDTIGFLRRLTSTRG